MIPGPADGRKDSVTDFTNVKDTVYRRAFLIGTYDLKATRRTKKDAKE